MEYRGSILAVRMEPRRNLFTLENDVPLHAQVRETEIYLEKAGDSYEQIR